MVAYRMLVGMSIRPYTHSTRLCMKAIHDGMGVERALIKPVRVMRWAIDLKDGRLLIAFTGYMCGMRLAYPPYLVPALQRRPPALKAWV